MIRNALFVLLASLSTFTNSETIDVEYSRFYSHVKKLNSDDTQGLQFAFGFLRVGEGRLCGINNAEIITDKQTLPLVVSSEGRFTVPQEKALKLADGIVRIDLAERANLCDMSVQLETVPEYVKTEYSTDDLKNIYSQYDAFFNEMGSFLSFMMPSVKGLMFQFEDKDLDFHSDNHPPIVKGIMRLDESWINESKGFTLPVEPLRITAIASGK
ncbi:DUF2987 domain-containing protein [Alteromonas sp. KUL49]|uniref:DUF2987 domain-containing protein n=1 Tax=Alteromonas sp. KUL49 TaxID=2480798 RepID=UPI00102EEF90|nr:DUF2987 domain-containing protein [Alteromonas sp. KUL49]TAP40808.1 DUF2987 domain-containing protein [Alteromonas sp. KUL49]GEA10985.1 hypothetical protein KUL49_13600 [Alteromonas sp. KUL49]